jgi:hypothetical protein
VFTVPGEAVHAAVAGGDPFLRLTQRKEEEYRDTERDQTKKTTKGERKKETRRVREARKDARGDGKRY